MKFVISATFVVISSLVVFWLMSSQKGTPGRTPSEITASVDAGRQSRVGAGRPIVSELRARIEKASLAEYSELMELLLKSGESGGQQELIEELVRRWLNEDPRSFSVFLDKLEVEDPSNLSDIAPGFMAALSKIDADVLQSFFLQELVERVVLAVSATDPRQALSWARD